MTFVRLSRLSEHSAVTLAAALLLTACASPSDTVYFITKTSTSIVDADTVPAGISIGYDRVEGYAGPRYADGSVFPVASSIESKGSGPGREVRQAFATGNAALIVTRQDTASGVNTNTNTNTHTNTNVQDPKPERKAVFFGTTTSIGLTLGFAATGPVPNAFTLGYKRKELAVIPVDQHKQNTSVLGSFTNNSGVAAAPEGAPSDARPTLRFDVQQYFATGTAAENLAAMPSIRDQFRDKAEQALGGVAKFRQEEARQGRLALDALDCAQKLMPTQFDRVLANAEALAMFGKLGGVAAIKAASDDAAKRQKYVTYMTHIDPDDEVAGQRLKLHKTTLCDWAEPKK